MSSYQQLHEDEEEEEDVPEDSPPDAPSSAGGVGTGAGAGREESVDCRPALHTSGSQPASDPFVVDWADVGSNGDAKVDASGCGVDGGSSAAAVDWEKAFPSSGFATQNGRSTTVAPATFSGKAVPAALPAAVTKAGFSIGMGVVDWGAAFGDSGVSSSSIASPKAAASLSGIGILAAPPVTTAAAKKAAAAPIDPWGMPAPAPVQDDPWSGTSTPAAAVDPWAPLEKQTTPAAPPPAVAVDPWAPLSSPAGAAAAADPWAPVAIGGASLGSPVQEEDEFAELTQRGATNGAARGTSSSPWDMTELGVTLTPSPVSGSPAMAARAPPPTSKSPHSFLGENSGLVNLDNLIGAPSGAVVPPPTPPQANPFGWTPAGVAATANPFQAAAPPPPSINQIRHRRFEEPTQQPTDPWVAPVSAANPFLS